MSEIEKLPMPADAPAPGRCVRVERPEPGLALLVLDPPHRRLAVLDLPLLRDLGAALESLDGERGLRGLVITGREPLSFLAGADLDALEAADDPLLVQRLVRAGQEVFQRIARLASPTGRVRTVAAIGGPVPGGAYELALACDRIVLADDPASRVGLPETRLGIIPAWGGSQRLPRRIGVPPALDAILKGSLLPPRPAFRRGMVDRLTPPEYLVGASCDVALGRKPCARRGRGLAGALLVDRNPLAAWIVASLAKKRVLAQTGGNYPAPLEAVRLVAWAPLRPLRKGLLAEQKAGARLAVGPVCKNLIGVFRLMEGAKKLGRGAGGERVQPVRRAGVLGAGVMGGGIASLFAEKGVATRLFDVAPENLDAAAIEHRRRMAKELERRRLRLHEHDAAIDKLDVTEELLGFGRAELVVEAVAEKLEVKREVLGRVASMVPRDALLCTNTSSLSVDAIAASLPAPERFAGLHFFNPVQKMPLVEIVRGSRTDPAVVTRLAALALALGKTPVVVADRPGFLVNRLLAPYLDEALCLYASGADPARIDAAATRFGMPMGPLRLLDEVGLDVAAHAARALHEAYGERMRPALDLRPSLAAKRLGKKSGRGFYVYAKGRPPVLAPDLAQALPPRDSSAAGLADDVIENRLLLAMLSEGLRALEEGVCASPADLDLATVLGIGFPPFRGGLFAWARSLGSADVRRRLDAIAASPGVAGRPGGPERFQPPASLSALLDAEPAPPQPSPAGRLSRT